MIRTHALTYKSVVYLKIFSQQAFCTLFARSQSVERFMYTASTLCIWCNAWRTPCGAIVVILTMRHNRLLCLCSESWLIIYRCYQCWLLQSYCIEQISSPGWGGCWQSHCGTNSETNGRQGECLVRLQSAVQTILFVMQQLFSNMPYSNQMSDIHCMYTPSNQYPSLVNVTLSCSSTSHQYYSIYYAIVL